MSDHTVHQRERTYPPPYPDGWYRVAADSLVAAGRLGIFTPMYFHKARKPE